jgi:hypothetical protein
MCYMPQDIFLVPMAFYVRRLFLVYLHYIVILRISYFCCHNPHICYCQAFSEAPKAPFHFCPPLLYSLRNKYIIYDTAHYNFKQEINEASCVMDDGMITNTAIITNLKSSMQLKLSTSITD